ncbi:hypothetical protein [Fontivita pretiosa]|uniref:hypothetical protein n=1 Tax=Fontivita pretiosa TaxID=2989684 RepID=UPI003D181CDB
MQKWLARLAFSFLVLCLLLLWQSYKLSQRDSSAGWWQVPLCLLGAAASGALALAGLRARHRM